MTYNLNKEINEAIRAGEYALRSLKDARKALDSAGNWGLLDIFGGKTISGLMKHSKVYDAKICMERARTELRRFQQELDDVDEYLPDIDLGGFFMFADFFFDGILADIFVQSRIGNAKKQVNEAIYRVESIVNRLKRDYLDDDNVLTITVRRN